MGQHSEVSTKSPSIDQSNSDTATDTEEEQGGGKDIEDSNKPPTNPQKEDSSGGTRSLSTQTGSTGWKYSEEEIKQGALLMYSSPKTYKLLRSFCTSRAEI